VIWGGRRSNAVPVEVAAAAPGLFASDPYGRGQAQASNEDGSINSAANAAAAGSMVTVTMTGDAGQPIAVWIGGHPAEVVLRSARQETGLVEMRVRVPIGVPAGPAVWVQMKAGEFFSQAGVTLAVK